MDLVVLEEDHHDQHGDGHAGARRHAKDSAAEPVDEYRGDDGHDEADHADHDGRDVVVHVEVGLFEEVDRVEEDGVDPGELLEEEERDEDEERFDGGRAHVHFFGGASDTLLSRGVLQHFLLGHSHVSSEPQVTSKALGVVSGLDQVRGTLRKELDGDQREDAEDDAQEGHGGPVEEVAESVGEQDPEGCADRPQGLEDPAVLRSGDFADVGVARRRHAWKKRTVEREWRERSSTCCHPRDQPPHVQQVDVVGQTYAQPAQNEGDAAYLDGSLPPEVLGHHAGQNRAYRIRYGTQAGCKNVRK